MVDARKITGDMERAILDAYYGGLNIPDERQEQVFKEYQKMAHYAFHMPRLERVLEIGAGFSTVLWAEVAQACRCEVYSIDMSYQNLLRKIEHTRFHDLVKKNITFLNGTSITKSYFESFYNRLPKKELGGIAADSIRVNLAPLLKAEFGIRKWKRLAEVLGVAEPSEIDLQQMFFTAEGLVFPEEIMRIYRNADDEFDYFSTHAADVSVLDDLLPRVDFFDVIFFDSGEFSSMPEWVLLKDRIRSGGIAVFHDIYFPKSFKNFLVCAAVLADPEWRVVYQDVNTPQGMLVAVRR